MTSFQNQLKALRKQRAITQEALAQLVGVSVRTVVRWEQGQAQPSPLALSRLRELKFSQTTGGRHGVSI